MAVKPTSQQRMNAKTARERNSAAASVARFNAVFKLMEVGNGELQKRVSA